MYRSRAQDVALKWRETKQYPSRARSGNQISCCLFSLHFLYDMLHSGTVDQNMPKKWEPHILSFDAKDHHASPHVKTGRAANRKQVWERRLNGAKAFGAIRIGSPIWNVSIGNIFFSTIRPNPKGIKCSAVGVLSPRPRHSGKHVSITPESM